MTKGAIRDFVFSFLKDDGVIHFERRKNSCVKEVTVGFSGDFRDDKVEHNVTGIAVRPARSRRKLSGSLFLQQFQNFNVLDLFFRRPDRATCFFQSVHQLLVVWQAGSVIQQVSNGNGFSVARKSGKDFVEGFALRQLTVVREQHDGHRSELLGEGSEPEIWYARRSLLSNGGLARL